MLHARPLLISMVLTLASSLLVGSAAPTTSQEPKARTKKAAAAKAKAAAAGKAEVQLVRLSVSKPARPRADGVGPPLGAGLKGTSLSLCVVIPGRHVVGCDLDACKLAQFIDDKGTVLLRPDAPRTWSGYSKAESEPHALILELSGDEVPAPGAATISLKADVVILCGSGEKTAEKTDIALVTGTKFSVGPFAYTIESTREVDLGESKCLLTLESGQPFDEAIREISFLDPAGKPMKSQLYSNGRGVNNGIQIYNGMFGLDRKVEKVTMRIVYFEKFERMHVPVDVTTGLGL
jgi:hypothetical protein